ncbi:diguanylate cyclase [Pseudobutyrivibrio ruminis]|uniref:Diguanylate cyclase n=1 Tax=Pseudobutyrivibrio ruminis TaxID=46206 RepID=A0A2G3E9F3_9FIRM|nr:HD domain-containing phosphohydrolase [Pseudobutyrivibrio ruminis]PHU39733.1 diguanylate cyclase [Pseudobutyrivibrio ruminis]
MSKISKARLMMIATIAGGILVNVVFAFLASRLNFPIYLDVIGTIGVAFTAGTLPALIVAVFTNLFCGIFDGMAMYYTLISMFIAIISSYYSTDRDNKKFSNIIKFIFLIGLLGGVLGASIQLLLLGKPEFASVSDACDLLTSSIGTNYYFNFFLLNSGLNIVDKGIAVFVVLSVVKFIPVKKINTLRNLGWKQRPLSRETMRKYGALSKKSGKLQRRFTRLLVGAAVAITIVMVLISMSIYFEHTKKEYTLNAHGAVRLAATEIDVNRIEEFSKRGQESKGYVETKLRLTAVKNNYPGIKHLYVYIIREDGLQVVFDVNDLEETEDTFGKVIPFDEAFVPYIDRLLAGEEIEDIQSGQTFGWQNTIMHPVEDADGVTKCYVRADVSMDIISDFIKEYLIRIVLIFTGYLAVILAIGLWVSRYYLVHPINAMVDCTNSFMYEMDNQAVLQDNVKKIKRLKIKTDDELENLYNALCKMTEDTAEQVNDIRYQNQTINQMQNGLIVTMADMVENRDSDTGYHIQKTADYVRIILEGLKKKGYYEGKLTPKFMNDVVMSAPLHDIGKINISDTVLNKPGKLTPEEYEIMKTHTTAGKNIMEKAINTVKGENYLKEARNMAAYHHEWWNGNGYPEGLKGQVIPLSARVMAVADVFDALTSKRVYKEAMPFEEAIDIIKQESGTHFDPKCVEVFAEAEEEVRLVLRRYQED